MADKLKELLSHIEEVLDAESQSLPARPAGEQEKSASLEGGTLSGPRRWRDDGGCGG
ncbi:MAG: hypothetical protein JW741_23835 [Sedimentisphaerales bacterium]|nr:hypothetical protein [Sedimentisphaerales bacterium]